VSWSLPNSVSASAVHSTYYQGRVKQAAVPYRSREIKYILVVKCRVLFLKTLHQIRETSSNETDV